jgi:NAD(P)-dependent dehydrogenase (short-subunit alcohol dehydrogenase family)
MPRSPRSAPPAAEPNGSSWTSRARRTANASSRAPKTAFGPLDLMVCNAGFGYYGTVEDTPPDTMRRMMDVNFMGTFLGTRAALPGFRARGRGHLVIVSSIVGQRGIAQMSGYSATKAAQAGFAEALRAEFAGSRSTSASCIRSRPRRSSDRRWRATTGTRSRASAPRRPPITWPDRSSRASGVRARRLSAHRLPPAHHHERRRPGVTDGS